MVLHLADDDLVPLGEAGSDEALRHQVDRLGRPPNEHDLAGVLRPEGPLDRGPRPLVGLGRLLGELVKGAVNVRVVPAVVARNGVDDGARLLGRRRVVEVDEGLSVDGALEDGKVLAQPRRVESRGLGPCLRGGAHASGPPFLLPASQRRRNRSRFSCKLSRGRSVRTSCTKPRTRIERAVSRSSPRDRR